MPKSFWDAAYLAPSKVRAWLWVHRHTSALRRLFTRQGWQKSRKNGLGMWGNLLKATPNQCQGRERHPGLQLPPQALENQTTSNGFPKAPPNQTTGSGKRLHLRLSEANKEDAESKIPPFPSVLPKPSWRGDRAAEPSPAEGSVGSSRQRPAALQSPPLTTPDGTRCPPSPRDLLRPPGTAPARVPVSPGRADCLLARAALGARRSCPSRRGRRQPKESAG